MPYTGNPSTDTTDQVRLLIWDVSTSTATEILSDGEIDWFISVSPNVYSAACLALNTMAGRVATLASSTSSVEEKKVGDLSLRFGLSASNTQGLVGAINTLCTKLEKQSALVGAGPFAGGLTISGKHALVLDTDRVKPWAARGGFDNPNATDLSASTSSAEST